ncbi:uncharacterized protein RCC_08692 [Ramularia collo-cygni]|uniref:Uncharacterized protein n=1 Tax=Ramularia collo-cygni TaxID=112498 RepID=A0A2D3VKQ2_9PEZI|nr:uncharacterized protein RCC_08692 [Ramularia collo-cygni]CZT22984.1 uncharacterized protein RCC_08692 [Ramularia collo-cygni]
MAAPRTTAAVARESVSVTTREVYDNMRLDFQLLERRQAAIREMEDSLSERTYDLITAEQAVLRREEAVARREQALESEPEEFRTPVTSSRRSTLSDSERYIEIWHTPTTGEYTPSPTFSDSPGPTRGPKIKLERREATEMETQAREQALADAQNEHNARRNVANSGAVFRPAPPFTRSPNSYSSVKISSGSPSLKVINRGSGTSRERSREASSRQRADDRSPNSYPIFLDQPLGSIIGHADTPPRPARSPRPRFAYVEDENSVPTPTQDSFNIVERGRSMSQSGASASAGSIYGDASAQWDHEG